MPSGATCLPLIVTITVGYGVLSCADTITPTVMHTSCNLNYWETYTFLATFPDGYTYSSKFKRASDLPTDYTFSLYNPYSCRKDYGGFRIYSTKYWLAGTVNTTYTIRIIGQC